MKDRSTATNLLVYKDFIINSFEDKRQVDSFNGDLCKAFDRVTKSRFINIWVKETEFG